MYSLSTCWNARRHADGRSMLEEVRSLGFEYAELGHNTRICLLEGIIDAVKNGVVKISSLHNFCPLPVGVNHSAPNLFQFSAEDNREFESAIRHTCKTLEFAARLEAPIVVTHFGSINVHGIDKKLKMLVEAGQRDTPRYERQLMEINEYLESQKERYMERSCQALEQILPKAKEYGLQIGIENREGVEEIPLDADFPILMARFPDPAITYWHDCGHAQIKENYGFLNHFFHLDGLTSRLGGMHVHDCKFPFGDHLPPGEGDTDFETLKPLIPSNVLKVLELNPFVPSENVIQGLAYIKSIWGEE